VRTGVSQVALDRQGQSSAFCATGIFIVVSIVCQDQSGTATVKPRQQVERGPVASNEVSLAHVDAYP
jgi:hypothetical protein